MNKNTLKNIHKEHAWTVADEFDLKHIQQEYKRAKDSASLKQMIDLSDRLLKGTVKAEFDGINTYHYVLKEVMNWVTEIDSSSHKDTGDIIMCELNQEDINILLDNYQIGNIDSVCSFLVENDFPCDFLEEAAKQIKLVFGRDTIILLDVINDPTLFANKGLFASIIPKCSVEEAVKGIAVLDKEWFIPHPNMNKKRFMFDVDWP